MKARYRLITRGSRGGMFYYFDKETKKRRSLQTTNEEEAKQIIEAKNNAERQPVLNLQIAKAYLAGADSSFVNRTWREVMDEFVRVKQGSNRTRSERAMADKACILATAWPRFSRDFQQVARCFLVCLQWTKSIAPAYFNVPAAASR